MSEKTGASSTTHFFSIVWSSCLPGIPLLQLSFTSDSFTMKGGRRMTSDISDITLDVVALFCTGYGKHNQKCHMHDQHFENVSHAAVQLYTE